MEVQLTRRPAASCCHRLLLSSSRRPSPSTRPLRPPPPDAARHKSSTSRTKRALNIPPHPSFLSPASVPKPSNNAAAAPAAGPSPSSHIIFNPPSAAPSVYHTPFKFLPRSDPRRRAQLPANLFSSSATIQYNATPASAAGGDVDPNAFPQVKPHAGSLYHLSEADVAEMRRLRAEDPVKNSVTALATRFGCAKLFVMMCCTSSLEHRIKMKEAFAEVRAKWGPRKAKAFEDRQRRWEMMLKGEL
ncbi:mitochondrial ribosomal protein subunit L20-domain-containing protein [Schizothecium vesticola]|uniref:Mitochondrial ribosomal protein subunit L20-domain-containing protein n=1 Tax=Schizothecium vesticola TaxID=314040 RepID=A0AA40FBI5_9PEZI|nr:mitochondrial ribosomal protein subunit L20-domain-containing protein [Schizothecium vesticola]